MGETWVKLKKRGAPKDSPKVAFFATIATPLHFFKAKKGQNAHFFKA